MRACVGALVVALLATGCAAGEDPPQATPSVHASAAAATPSEETPSPGAPTAAPAQASCGRTKTIPEQSGSHLVGDVEPPVPYNSTPPTSGWHSSGAVAITISRKPLSEPEQVSVLEAGGVVVSYRDLPGRDLARLRRVIRADYVGKVALTPYAKLERGQVAVTAWAKLMLCDGVDIVAVRRFADQHATGEAAGDH